MANAAVKDTFGYNTYKDGLLRQKLTDGWVVNDKQQGGLGRWWFGDRGYSQFKLDKNALNEKLMQDSMGWRQRGGVIGGLGWGEIGRADRGVRGLNEMLAGKVPRSGSWAGRDPASLAGRQSMIAEMADAAGVTLKDNQLSEAAMRGYKPLRGVQQGAMSVDDFLINEKAGIYQDFGDSSLFSQRMGDNLTDRQIRQAQRRARTGPVQNQQGRVHQGFGGSVSAMEAEIERNKTRRAIT